jgi:hypothetical protein
MYINRNKNSIVEITFQKPSMLSQKTKNETFFHMTVNKLPTSLTDEDSRLLPAKTALIRIRATFKH